MRATRHQAWEEDGRTTLQRCAGCTECRDVQDIVECYLSGSDLPLPHHCRHMTSNATAFQHDLVTLARSAAETHDQHHEKHLLCVKLRLSSI